MIWSLNVMRVLSLRVRGRPLRRVTGRSLLKALLLSGGFVELVLRDFDLVDGERGEALRSHTGRDDGDRSLLGKEGHRSFLQLSEGAFDASGAGGAFLDRVERPAQTAHPARQSGTFGSQARA